MPTPTPDAAGYVAAQQRLRSAFGETVVFIKPSSVTFPPNTNIDPSTGQPYDPAIKPTASASAGASAQCDVFFRAISRGGGTNEYSETAADLRDKALVMLITDIANKPVVDGAIRASFRGDTWQIMSVKPDGIFGVERLLIYVKQI